MAATFTSFKALISRDTVACVTSNPHSHKSFVKVAATDENGARIGYKYAQGSQQGIAGELTEKFRNLLKDIIVKADYAGNLAVFKTYSGMANAAAAAIDAMHDTSIVGSVAGDDTVLCVLRTEDAAKEFADLIGQTIG